MLGWGSSSLSGPSMSAVASLPLLPLYFALPSRPATTFVSCRYASCLLERKMMDRPGVGCQPYLIAMFVKICLTPDGTPAMQDCKRESGQLLHRGPYLA